VLPGDTEDSLAARVLATEHCIYPTSVDWFVRDRLRIQNGVVHQTDAAPQLLR
jgi:phosphoribosylglycinamide formyltransferase-1